MNKLGERAGAYFDSHAAAAGELLATRYRWLVKRRHFGVSLELGGSTLSCPGRVRLPAHAPFTAPPVAAK